MKNYSIISIIFIAIVSLFTYMNTDATTTFTLFGVNITLYNALWTALFLSIFYLISIIYFLISKYKNFRFERDIKKDKENLLKNISNKILYKDKLFPIKQLKEFEEFIEMIDGLNIKPIKSETFPFMEDLIKLNNGEVVDLTTYRFSKDNPWVLKNIENSIKSGDKKIAKEALHTDLKDKAIQLLAEKADVREILANNYPITKKFILENLESDRLKELIDNSNLSNKDYIDIAKVVHKNATNPEKLFEIFKNKLYAYLYLLIEYEMIDKAYEIVKEKEIKLFEYYLLLRKNGIKIDIKEYLDVTL